MEDYDSVALGCANRKMFPQLHLCVVQAYFYLNICKQHIRTNFYPVSPPQETVFEYL